MVDILHENPDVREDTAYFLLISIPHLAWVKDRLDATGQLKFQS